MKEQEVLDIERAALDLLLQYRKEGNLSETELGKLAFPEAARPRSKVNALWSVKTDGGKPLRLRLGDFCAMCDAMGKDPSQELFTLWQRHKISAK
ncbi:MAG: hypothetical protein IJS54_03880 [Desulfovibrio sp.]|nr:hypothetical protein [Desulfovibrio sp.]